MALARVAGSVHVQSAAPDPGGSPSTRRYALLTRVFRNDGEEPMGSTERNDRRDAVQPDRDRATDREGQRSTDAEPQSRWRYTSAIDAARAVGGGRAGLSLDVS
jgi:hypothetical protein